MNSNKKYLSRQKRHARIRKTVIGSKDRPRLSVYKSNSYIYAQLIDDDNGTTLTYANSLEKELRDKYNGKLNIPVASEVGKLIAERAKELGISSVVFDRGGFAYHGKIKSLADAAREAGLLF